MRAGILMKNQVAVVDELPKDALDLTRRNPRLCRQRFDARPRHPGIVGEVRDSKKHEPGTESGVRVLPDVRHDPNAHGCAPPSRRAAHCRPTSAISANSSR